MEPRRDDGASPSAAKTKSPAATGYSAGVITLVGFVTFVATLVLFGLLAYVFRDRISIWLHHEERRELSDDHEAKCRYAFPKTCPAACGAGSWVGTLLPGEDASCPTQKTEPCRSEPCSTTEKQATRTNHAPSAACTYDETAPCLGDCGSAAGTRTIRRIFPPANERAPVDCPATRMASCTTDPCPPSTPSPGKAKDKKTLSNPKNGDDCVYGSFGPCSTAGSCGPGVQVATRLRGVDAPWCPAQKERSCAGPPCCTYGPWGPCSTACGPGVETRVRLTGKDGDACPSLLTRPCQLAPC